MKEEFEIILLPSQDGKGSLVMTMDELYLLSLGNAVASTDDIISHHLYIISDDEIKQGDWYYYKDDEGYNHIFNWAHGCFDNTASKGKKIIVSTDKSLNLPWIDNSFVSKYIDLYNKKYPIKFIGLEMMDFYDGFDHHGDKVKINNDGSVIISYEEPEITTRTVDELIVIPKSIIDIIKSNKGACSINDVIDMLEQNNKPLKNLSMEIYKDGALNGITYDHLDDKEYWLKVDEKREDFFKKHKFEV